MWTGLAGLKSNSLAISVVGDNLANSNTVGYRGSRALFEDILIGNIVGIGELGGGSGIAAIDKLFTQGAMVGSSRPSDMAINGRGFFIVDGNHGGIESNYYTRAGMFHVDKDGFLVNTGGLKVQGFNANLDGDILTSLTDIQVEPTQMAPQATSLVNISVNLDPGEQPPALAWDATDAANTSNASASVILHDSLGTPHDATLYYVRTAAGWDYHVVLDGAELDGGTAGTPTEIANGSLAFNTDGALQTETVGTDTVNFLGATANQQITFDFGDSIDPPDSGTGLTGTTGFSNPFVINSIDQNGYASGDLIQFIVEKNGLLQGRYSNGESLTLAQVALADFRDLQGLERVGDTLFAETVDSGTPLVGFAATGGKGVIEGSALEQSNIDVSEEFVTMIAAQRAFQAASRTITTADELTQETLALKR